MIKTGEIQLKNQEEIALFSSHDSICTSLLSLVQRRKEAERELLEKDSFILSHPAKNRIRQVEMALDEISNDREKVRSDIREIEAEIKVMEKEIPKKIHDLERALMGTTLQRGPAKGMNNTVHSSIGIIPSSTNA